jgi:hypothetical protein
MFLSIRDSAAWPSPPNRISAPGATGPPPVWLSKYAAASSRVRTRNVIATVLPVDADSSANRSAKGTIGESAENVGVGAAAETLVRFSPILNPPDAC